MVNRVELWMSVVTKRVNRPNWPSIAIELGFLFFVVVLKFFEAKISISFYV